MLFAKGSKFIGMISQKDKKSGQDVSLSSIVKKSDTANAAKLYTAMMK